MTKPAPHTVTFTENGITNPAHPDPDHAGCDFETYLATDWPAPGPMAWGDWLFYWQTDPDENTSDEPYWAGTPAPVEG